MLSLLNMLIGISELKKVNQNDLWKQIQDHVKEKWIMGCSTAPASSGDTSNVIDKYGIVRVCRKLNILNIIESCLYGY